MKTVQPHLYCLKKHTNWNTLIKPLTYKVHLLFLELSPILKYYGYSVISFRQSTDREKKIRVYIDTEHITILKVLLILSSKWINKIDTEDIIKRINCVDIPIKQFIPHGLCKIAIFFYYENGEDKVEGIYVSNVRKGLHREENSISRTHSKDNNCIHHCRNKLYYFRFQSEKKKKKKFNFKKVQFENKSSYRYINTFCELFYLPLVFPCLHDNIYKVNFKLRISFHVRLKNEKDQKIYPKILPRFTSKKLSSSHVNACSIWRRKGDRKIARIRERWTIQQTCKNEGNKRYLINVLSPSNLVVSNSKLKRVYYSRCKGNSSAFLLTWHHYSRKGKDKKRSSNICYMEPSLQNGGRGESTHIGNTSVLERITHFVRYTKHFHGKRKMHWEKEKEFITYEFNSTKRIINYTFCLFIGLTESNFLQFMVLNKYKYAGEENHNCLTFLTPLIGINEQVENGEDGYLRRLLLGIKRIVHEIFHILWGNCIYFKKENYLWCKEGLTRYYELKYCNIILSKIKNIQYSKLLVLLWYILEYYFYVLIIDTLNIYNHSLNMGKNNVRKKKHRLNEQYCVLEWDKTNIYTKSIHHFYNTLTYNKGMHIFRMISIMCKPHFDYLINFMYYTFYNHSVSSNKIFTFIHFFFLRFRINPFILKHHNGLSRGRWLHTVTEKKKYIGAHRKEAFLRDNSSPSGEIERRKKRKHERGNKSDCQYVNLFTPVLFPHTCSNFLKLTLKRNFLTYYTKLHRRNGEIGKAKHENKNENKFVQLYVRCMLKRVKMENIKKNVLKSAMKSYLNVVGPPKVFFKFIKNKNKLLITQKHFYYDNYEQQFRETNTLFQVPLVFTFNKQIYKILLTKKNIFIDAQLGREKYTCEEEKRKMNARGCTFSIRHRNSCYFSYHFVHKLLKSKENGNDEANVIGMILCLEFFKCYIHFSSYFSKIENKKIKIEIRKELLICKHASEMDKEVEFLFKDFRNYLSKILFFFKESISSLL
ncbi:M1-family alanyl aminopeptidase, putative [Plasmodium ovale wallikeri]|uniref:M1-family alanyl aminopeptidase, putative n=1 Tax=Plasmodium ovale wallikeri TaxID=864142 RepID=A0A1A8ZE20_PLAOA|nr:M1-family alanyl aminopeptidase, putative [Plasmodium ovale wallikeri]SBT42049.1 M1-family alanyl aminopeptidase, putative [Plasmodium ovale wallikeri]